MKPDPQQLNSWWEFGLQDLLVDVAAVIAATEIESPLPQIRNSETEAALRWSEWQSFT
jgi:hypothetical protein